jgi:hypothetical protein
MKFECYELNYQGIDYHLDFTAYYYETRSDEGLDIEIDTCIMWIDEDHDLEIDPPKYLKKAIEEDLYKDCEIIGELRQECADDCRQSQLEYRYGL